MAPTSNEYRRLRNLLLVIAVGIAATIGIIYASGKRADEWETYRTCLRGNETRGVIKSTFEDVGNTIDKLIPGGGSIRHDVIDPNVKKLGPRECNKP